MSKFDLFSSIEAIDDLPDVQEVREEKNIFPTYVGRPADNLNNFDNYCQELINEIKNILNDEEYNEYLGFTSEKVENFKNKLKTVVGDNIKYIYTIIDYPLSITAYFKFYSNQPVTYGMLLYAYTIAYQKIYKLEEVDNENPGHIPGTLNRAKSSGRYGIWGHDIGDLVYNGNSKIKINKDSVLCYFSCDS